MRQHLIQHMASFSYGYPQLKKACLLAFYFSILASLCLSCAHPLLAQNVTWHKDIEKAKQLARVSNQPLLLDFYAPWCSYCRRLQKEVYPDPRVLKILRKYITVRIDGEANANLATQYHVNAFPTIVILDANGVQHDSLLGFHSAPVLSQKLHKLYLRTKERHHNIELRLTQKPQSYNANMDAGNYFLEASNYEKAYSYFLQAWKHTEDKLKKNKALYNAAICSMRQNKYKTAIKEWEAYLKVLRRDGRFDPEKSDHIYARYYHGLAHYYGSTQKNLEIDSQKALSIAYNQFKFVSTRLPVLEDRLLAQDLVLTLKKQLRPSQ